MPWLDVLSQAQILYLLETLAKDLGLTLACIRYNLGVIRRICGRVLVMQSGKIVEFPAPTQFFDTCEADHIHTLLDAFRLPNRNQICD